MAPRIDSDSDSDVPLGQVKARNGVNGHSKTRPPGSKRKLSAAGIPSAPPSKRSKQKPSSPSTHRAQAATSVATNGKQLNGVSPKKEDASSSDEEPLANPAKQIVSIAIAPPATGEALSSDMPLASNAAAAAVSASQTTAPIESSSESGVDVPLARRAARSKPAQAAVAPSSDLSDADEDMKSESDSDDDVPLAKKRKKAPKAGPKARKSAAKKEEPATPPPKKNKKSKMTVNSSPAKSSPTKSPSKKSKKEEEEEEEVFKWWEQDALGDGTQKWTTLEHGGVLFPPPYEPVPKDVKLLYDGKPVLLSLEAEEVAGFFGAMLETDHARDETFCKNFFKDFRGVLGEFPSKDSAKIKDFAKCNFSKLHAHYESERDKKKALTTAEKKAIKAKKDEMEEPYLYCLLDGRKEKIGNFRAEPPGLFRGRGEHPKKGALKHRLKPEAITLNIGDNAPIPTPNIPGQWGHIIHDNTVTWLAHWKENVNGNSKYVFLAAGSSLKGQSDMQKFEKARELKKHIAAVRADYQLNLTAKVNAERQLATALYFIDKLALRAGNEKNEEEADTVGCCSLRFEHVTLQPPNVLVFDFLGKDSIRYYNEVEVEPQVFKNIRIFKSDPKVEGDDIFDRITTTMINKHLTSYMKGLTAKVFRTYNASITFQQQLDERTPVKGSLIEKLAAYNEANRMVAILCNHQKAVSKNHESAMEKLGNQVRAIKYQRMKLRHALFGLNSKYKKKKEYAEDESDIDDEWIAQYEDESREKEIEKANKKFEKDNEKLVADGEKPLTKDDLKSRIAKINDEYKRLKKERGKKTIDVKASQTEEKIIAAIQKVDERLKVARFKTEDRENLKTVSLGTSKLNYLDPRITTAWCKKYNVPVEKMFSKTLMVKFPWAMEVDEKWKF